MAADGDGATRGEVGGTKVILQSQREPERSPSFLSEREGAGTVGSCKSKSFSFRARESLAVNLGALVEAEQGSRGQSA
jgi:hypothetical protein